VAAARRQQGLQAVRAAQAGAHLSQQQHQTQPRQQAVVLRVRPALQTAAAVPPRVQVLLLLPILEAVRRQAQPLQ
jgi:hypothetical protein